MIYADVIFIMNFISSAALFFAYRLIFTIKFDIPKILISASICGIYSVFEILLEFPKTARIALLLSLSFLQFGKSGGIYNGVRLMLLTILLEMIFIATISVFGKSVFFSNGTVSVFAGDVFGALAYIAAYPLLFTINKIKAEMSKIKKVSFIVNNKKFTAELLYDSGNLLMYNNHPIAVISWSALSSAFPDKEYQELLTTCTVIPFKALDGVGYMPIIKPEEFLIFGCRADVYIAITERLFENCEGIIGKIK